MTRAHPTRRKVLLLSLSLVAALAVDGVPGEAPPETAGEEEQPPSLKLGAKRSFVLFPTGHLYPLDIADPHRPTFSVLVMRFSSTEIIDAGDNRFGLKLGGSFGLFRIHGLQLSLLAGFNGQFDRDNSEDNIGWDGHYGLTLGYRTSEALAFKLEVFHTSSHIGDEYAERTGRQRINYTREELIAGLSWSFASRWRTYGEIAYGYKRRNPDLQEPGRAQLGLEYEADNTLWKRRIGWYAAVNSSASEERDWNIDLTVQAGLALKTGERVWRLGLEYYDGRSLIGEFFQEDESYTALGAWLDF